MIINHNYCIKLVPLVIFINAVFAGTDSEKSCSVKIWKHLYAGCAPYRNTDDVEGEKYRYENTSHARNINKIGIQCICWFYSQVTCVCVRLNK